MATLNSNDDSPSNKKNPDDNQRCKVIVSDPVLPIAPNRRNMKAKLSLALSSEINKVPKFLPVCLSAVPEGWKNFVIRTIFTILLFFFFGCIVYLGPVALTVTTLCVQMKCFGEIIKIGNDANHIPKRFWFRTLSWYFYIVFNLIFYGENFVDYFAVSASGPELLSGFLKYHHFICFILFMIGIVWFVLSLEKKFYLRLFSMLSLTHFALLIIILQSIFLIQNIFEGMIWFIVPVSIIIINDICAYLIGFFLGRTPLIKLSPKKTWEGYIGGSFLTIILSCLISHFLCRYDYFVLPVEFDKNLGIFSMAHERSYLFQLNDYVLPGIIGRIMKMLRFNTVIRTYPFVLHSLIIALFGSIIGPFGGFFASGFKRAFKVKDFGDTIPGHGGIMDRFDCQYLMATFIKVYIITFTRTPFPQRLLYQLLKMPREHQLLIYKILEKSLQNQGHL
ncbi:hypothetical protein QYM36_010285 [Artemia franciscana]|uniref:Phosphatidate cytidylyltransferase n=1 Tax=Artemia franciscana TaxID=6661 RepID=A0AA88HWV2_ARTSF|nr:hypothetical protein QYM36_010285 [Artemia franciscana]